MAEDTPWDGFRGFRQMKLFLSLPDASAVKVHVGWKENNTSSAFVCRENLFPSQNQPLR